MKYRARKRVKFGSTSVHYFRNYSASASTSSARGGFTSHGIKVGPFTYNLTTRTFTWDSPGPGSVSHTFDRR